LLRAWLTIDVVGTPLVVTGGWADVVTGARLELAGTIVPVAHSADAALVTVEAISAPQFWMAQSRMPKP
jgi:hypothetical protein